MSGDEKTAELKRIYKCDVCGNIVEVLHSGVGQLVCCGQPMRLVAEVEEGSAAEKHVPIVDYGEKITVKVGSVPHPMEEKHYIEWIAVETDDATYRKYLQPGAKPEAQFELKADKVLIKAYCNIHGLWVRGRL